MARTCTKRKIGFNGGRYCGKPAVWRADLVVAGEPVVLFLCVNCAESLVERGDPSLTKL